MNKVTELSYKKIGKCYKSGLISSINNICDLLIFDQYSKLTKLYLLFKLYFIEILSDFKPIRLSISLSIYSFINLFGKK